ncbi:type II toxin-antitoxin system RelE/ParE family toxin [Sphaerimonospora sp. CA-214678]|uniref:type II toxin-antitoxin system RelE/ParE family toxin n=1 Tax=Sphaerimonospora sp. CA-214678 TaxID=3240029 RepID=UPI003D8DACBD
MYYEDTKFRKRCESDKERRRHFGHDRANILAKRIQQFQQAESLDEMRMLSGHCEELAGDRKGQLSIRLDANYRLIFEPEGWIADNQGSLDWTAVTAVVLIEIVDYH